MSDRFFSSRPILTDRAALDGPEAHHLLHVMRVAVGKSVTLFDDSGAEFIAIVESLGRSHVELRVTERLEINRELPFALIAGIALPKGDRQKWLVEKLTELGVTALVPLVTERGVAQPTASALDRLRRSVIEAAKQCGRNRLMQVHEPQSWHDWISMQTIPGVGSLGLSRPSPRNGVLQPLETRRLLSHPGGRPLHPSVDCNPLPTQLAIGPEGGFTDGEVATAIAAGWQTVDLGPRLLRVETAAVALAAALALCSFE
jgi:16S rRNA (uracil1498-N3)-methyltransferase